MSHISKTPHKPLTPFLDQFQDKLLRIMHECISFSRVLLQDFSLDILIDSCRLTACIGGHYGTCYFQNSFEEYHVLLADETVITLCTLHHIT